MPPPARHRHQTDGLHLAARPRRRHRPARTRRGRRDAGERNHVRRFDPEARALYWKQAETALLAKGVDAWWTDCSEPFEADWNGAREPSPEERMRINTTEAERYLGPDRSNAYSLLHSRGIWEGQRATGSPKRVLNLTRSAYPGPAALRHVQLVR
nr:MULTISPECIES: TIM-barrel domain-containing protein [Streptomyces]